MSIPAHDHAASAGGRPPTVISVFDLFTIGIGPSSSHTVGPMHAARRFAETLADEGLLAATARVHTDLYGALGATARDVGRLVLGQTLTPVGVGLAVGASLALATGIVVMIIAKPVGAIVHLLDPVAYVSGILLIIFACGVAAWFPTMNAARIDPMKSLRHD